jgi:rare lipoprotein A
LSGQHAARHQATPEPPPRRRSLIPATVGVLVAALLVGGAIASLQLGPPTPKSSTITTTESRPVADRADRSELREVPTQSPSPSPSKSPSPTPSKTKAAPKSTPPTSAGVASSGTCGVSYYDTGSRTANGERFDPNGLTAAHKTLPFNTRVRVTNPANGKSVIVRINDRGPFISGRCLDLARGAFVMIASVSTGVLNNARYEVLK